MNLKKSFLSLALAATFTATTIAAPINEGANNTVTVTQDIKSLIKNLDLDYSKIDDTTIKVKFMVNEDDELIVIGTDSKMDNTIKHALNYKQVDATGLKPFSVYVVPVKFEEE